MCEESLLSVGWRALDTNPKVSRKVLDLLGSDAPIQYLRAVLIAEAAIKGSYFPTSIPPEKWHEGPHLHAEMEYSEWFSGRIECYIPELDHLELRARFQTKPGQVRTGSLFVSGETLESAVGYHPDLLAEGFYVEGAKPLTSTQWRLAFHDPCAKCYAPEFYKRGLK